MTADVLVDFLEPVTREFFLLKGLVGLLATVLLVVHMVQTWADPLTLGRRLRYYSLLFTSFIITSASYEQIHDDALVNWRNIGGLCAVLLIAVAAGVSVVEDHRDHRERV